MSRIESSPAFQFVQEAQVIAGFCSEAVGLPQLSAVWRMLRHFPRDATRRELVMAVAALSRFASGFSMVRARTGLSRTSPRAGSRGLSVSHMLRLAVAEHQDPELAAARIATRLGLSTGYLSRALAAETHYPFRTHLNGIRMLAAVRCLQDPCASISCIAIRVGYVSAGELDRQFSRWFHLSPGRFRSLLDQIPADRLRR